MAKLSNGEKGEVEEVQKTSNLMYDMDLSQEDNNDNESIISQVWGGNI